MSVQWEKVHVFISSTFNDMHAERDYLVKRVFPALADWCERRKLRLVDVDLRWGVTENDATANANVVRTCLKRIDDCRPFFVCLLGQRYGWAPEQKHVSDGTLEDYPHLSTALDAGASVTEMEIQHAIIRPYRDAPPDKLDDRHYQLAEHSFFYLREPGYLDELPTGLPVLWDAYIDTDKAVDDLAQHVAPYRKLTALREETIPATGRPVRNYRAKWDPDRRTPEIELPPACTAFLAANVRRWQVDWGRALGPDVAFTRDGGGSGTEPESMTAGDLAKLAERLKSQGEKAVFEATNAYRALSEPFLAPARAFNARLTQGRLADFRVIDGTCEGDDLAGKDLALAILCDLKAAIVARHPDHVEVEHATGLQRELDQQEQFLFLSSDGFIKCGNDLAELDDYVLGDSQQLLVLTAEGGMGKSMLLANWIDLCRHAPDRFPNTTFHARFVGQSDGSSSVAGLLRLLLEEMQDVAGKLPRTTFEKQTDPNGREIEVEVPFEIPADPRKVPQFWKEQLPRLGERGRTVIVIDALNQLESGLRDVNWLPLQGLPPGVKLIVSFRSGAEGAAALVERLKRNPHVKFDDVAPFEDVADRQRLVAKYLEQYLKELDDKLVDQLVQATGAANPLYLKVVLSELRVFGSFTGLREKIERDFGPTPKTAFGALLRRLERDPAYSVVPPEVGVPMLFGLMRHARRGLIAREIAALIAAEHGLQAEDRRDAEEAVQVILRQVKPYLSRQDGLHAYFYESFQQAATARYVTGEVGEVASPAARDASAWHSLLAAYFTGQPLVADNRQSSSANRRKLDEQAFQHIGAKEWDAVRALLTDYEYVRVKLEAIGVQPLIEDFDMVAASEYDEHDVALVRNALVIGSDALEHDYRQLPTWLSGRLMKHPESVIQELIAQVDAWTGWPWLRLSRPLRIEDNLLGVIRSLAEISSNPSGSLIAASDADDTIKIRDAVTGSILFVLGDIPSGCRILAVAPDGSYLVLGAEGDDLIQWNVNDNRRVATIKVANGSSAKVVPSSDGSYVAVLDGREIILWDMDTGDVAWRLDGHQSRVNACAFSRDNMLVVSASADGTVKIWDAQLGSAFTALPHKPWNGAGLFDCTTLHSHDDPDSAPRGVMGIALSPREDMMASCGSDGVLRLWSLPDGRCVAEMAGHEGAVNACAFSQDGCFVVTAGEDNVAVVWDVLRECKLVDLRGHTVRDRMSDHGIVSCAFSQDGRLVITGGSDGRAIAWDAASGVPRATLSGHGAWVSKVALSQDDRHIVTIGGNSARSWSIPLGQQASEVLLDDAQCFGELNCLAANGPADIVATAGLNGTLAVWDVHGKYVRLCPVTDPGWIYTCQVDAEGEWLVSAHENGNLQLWDAASGEPLGLLGRHGRDAYSCDISPDGSTVASIGGDDVLRIWDVLSRRQVALRDIAGTGDSALKACRFSPTGEHLLLGCGSMAIVFETRRLTEVERLRVGSVNWSLPGAFSAAGDRFVSLSDHDVTAWDCQTWQPVAVAHVPGVYPEALAVSPDDGFWAVGHYDGHLTLLNGQSLAPWKVLDGCSQRVHSCTVSPDGRSVASIHEGDLCIVWDVESGDAVASFLAPEPLRAVRFNQDEPVIALGGSYLFLADLRNRPYTLPHVTAVEHNQGLRVRCPRCHLAINIDLDTLGTSVMCPSRACVRSMSINPFAVRVPGSDFTQAQSDKEPVRQYPPGTPSNVEVVSQLWRWLQRS